MRWLTSCCVDMALCVRSENLTLIPYVNRSLCNCLCRGNNVCLVGRLQAICDADYIQVTLRALNNRARVTTLTAVSRCQL